MIRQTITLPKYGGWTIYAYYATTEYAVDEIMERLHEVGVDSQRAKEAYESLAEGELDTGMCYSNFKRRTSVVVIGRASSAAEFFNSLMHEIAAHLCVHIASALYIDIRSEDYAYLVGDVSGEIYPVIKHQLCDCCRDK